MYRHIATEVVFMHASKLPQIRAQPSPHPFARIRMCFARAIAVRIARPFARRVAHGRMRSLDRGITVVFIRVDVRALSGEPLHMRAQGDLLGVGHYPQSQLTGQPPDCPQYRWSVIGEGTTPTSFISSHAWRIGRVEMLAAFLARVLEHFVAF